MALILGMLRTFSTYPVRERRTRTKVDGNLGGLYPLVNEHTVDGKNPTPVDMVNIPLFTGFYTSRVVSRISSINSSNEQIHLQFGFPFSSQL